MEFKTACFTGHRPEKLGGYDESNPIADSVKESLKYVIEKLILEHNVTRFISGGALGVDQWAAEIVLELKTKHSELILIIARPFPSQDSIWQAASKLRAKKIINLADEVVDISQDPFASWKMMARNKYMVENSNWVIAVWDGDPKSGTANTVKTAVTLKKNIVYINPREKTVSYKRGSNE